MATAELTPATGSSEPPPIPPRSPFPLSWEEGWEDHFQASSPELEQKQGELWHTVKDLAEDLGVAGEQMEAAIELAEQMNETHPPLCSHCLRVSLLAVEAADFLGVNRGKALLAGLLHDVGKMNVRPETLKKTTRFSFDDQREMNRHSKAGHDILSSYNVLPPELPLVIGTHHKRQLSNANGMDEDGLSPEAKRLRDAVTIADFIDASFRNDGHANDTSQEARKNRNLEHISYVLEQTSYNSIENKTDFANSILNTLLATRIELENFSQPTYA